MATGDKFVLKFEGTGEEQPDGSMHVIGSLTTHAATAIPSNFRALNITDDAVSLAWDARDGSTWNLYRDAVLVATLTSPTYVDSGLDPNTQYDYEVTAQSIGGTSDPAALSVTTLSAPATQPDPPDGFTLVQVTYRSVQFSWTSVAETEWDVYRDTVLVASGLTTAEYSESGLADETDYDYTVVARKGGEDSDPSDVFTITTLQNAPPQWNAIADIVSTVGGNGALNLPPNVSDPEEQPMVYTVEAGALPPGLSLNANGQITGTFTTAGNYSATLGADDGESISTVDVNWAIASLPDTTAPTIPQNPAGSVNGSTVTLTWDLSTDAESGVKHYVIRKNNAFYTTTPGPPFVDSNVANGDYVYHIRAVDNSPASNTSANSNPINVTVNVQSPQPDVPTQFVAAGASTTSIALSWQPGPSGPAPTDYDVDFSTVGPSGPWTALPVTGTATTFNHTGLSNQQYWYRLRANNGAFSSGFTTATGSPINAPQSVAFIIAAGTKTFDMNDAVDVDGVRRAVKAGETIQINQRTATTGTMLEITNPKGNLLNPCRFVPPANTQVLFKRSAAAGGFVVHVIGPRTPNWTSESQRLAQQGALVFDGFTTGASITPDADTGLKFGFKFQAFNSNDNPTAWIKCFGFVSVRLRYVHFDTDVYGTSDSGSCFGPNDNELDRENFSGLFRGPFSMEYCKTGGTTGIYVGSNVKNGTHGAGMPCKDVHVRFCWWENTGQTAILVKNCWEGIADVSHNFVIKSGLTANGAVQKNSIAMTASVGSCHHNWVENTANNISGGAQSPNHALRFDVNKGPPDNATDMRNTATSGAFVTATGGAFYGYNKNAQGLADPYPPFLMRLYSNIIFKGPEMGFRGNSDADCTQYKFELFSNTIDNFADYGISFGTVASGSFGRNNVVTRCRPSGAQTQGLPSGDVAKNFITGNRGDADGTLSGVFTNVAGKNYRLAAARAVAGGTVLGTDLATSDFLSAYSGTMFTDDGASDVTRSTAVGADMGALERA